MFIILKCYSDNTCDDIINIFYGQDVIPINNWVNEFLLDEVFKSSIESTKYIKDISYHLTMDEQGNHCMNKKYRKINKGYVYNTSEYITDILFKVKILYFDGNNISSDFNISELQQKITEEINNRVLNNLDKPSLNQVFEKLQNHINTKHNWNSSEFSIMVSEVIKNFKKDLYSSVAKKMKRFGKNK